MLRRRAVLLSMFWLLGPAVAPLRAQNTPRPNPAELFPDTSVWRPILEFVLDRATWVRLPGVSDTTITPWQFKLPSDTHPWPQLERQLRQRLRARDVTPADNVYRALSIGALRSGAGEVRAQLRTSLYTRCPRSELFGGYSNTEDVVVTLRPGGGWSQARAPVVEHGDRFCGMTVMVHELKRLEEAAKQLSIADSAVALGYQREQKECRVEDGHGAAGHHFVHPALLDGTLEVERPEVLLFEDGDGGALRLAGVQYIVPFSAWPPDSTPPYRINQALRPDPAQQRWFLHVWWWKADARGLFADAHRDLRCIEREGR